MLSAQRDYWTLADAVLDDVPRRGEGSGNVGRPASYVNIGSELAAVAVEMGEAQITKADGTPYTPSYLANLRDAAIMWPPEQRQAEASFDCHRANGGATRPVFLALCAHARGDAVEVPTEVEPAAWRAATTKIANGTRGYPVKVEAVRMALQRAPKNTPTRLDRATFAELLGHLSVGLEGLRAFKTRLAETAAVIEADDRLAMIRILDHYPPEVAEVRELLLVDLSDEALAQVTQEWQR